jgi:hypothetical protein
MGANIVNLARSPTSVLHVLLPQVLPASSTPSPGLTPCATPLVPGASRLPRTCVSRDAEAGGPGADVGVRATGDCTCDE